MAKLATVVETGSEASFAVHDDAGRGRAVVAPEQAAEEREPGNAILAQTQMERYELQGSPVTRPDPGSFKPVALAGRRRQQTPSLIIGCESPANVATPRGKTADVEDDDRLFSPQPTDTSGREPTEKNVPPVEGAEHADEMSLAVARLKIMNNLESRRGRGTYQEEVQDIANSPQSRVASKAIEEKQESGQAEGRGEADIHRERGFDLPTLGWSYSYYDTPESAGAAAEPTQTKQPASLKKP